MQVQGAQLYTLPYHTLPYLRRTLVQFRVRFRQHTEMLSTRLRFWMGEAAYWSETY